MNRLILIDLNNDFVGNLWSFKKVEKGYELELSLLERDFNDSLLNLYESGKNHLWMTLDPIVDLQISLSNHVTWIDLKKKSIELIKDVKSSKEKAALLKLTANCSKEIKNKSLNESTIGLINYIEKSLELNSI